LTSVSTPLVIPNKRLPGAHSNFRTRIIEEARRAPVA
jgi:hypothetical protein